MKTLDEVIKVMADCFDHTYNIVPLECEPEYGEDALHYLKEYRDKHDEMLKMEEALGYCEMADNRPLTWEQLKQMEGKPVWVEYSGYTPNWEIVENTGAIRGSTGDFTGNFIETNKSVLHKDTQGKAWQAYRKERE